MQYKKFWENFVIGKNFLVENVILIIWENFVIGKKL